MVGMACEIDGRLGTTRIIVVILLLAQLVTL